MFFFYFLKKIKYLSSYNSLLLSLNKKTIIHIAVVTGQAIVPKKQQN